MRPIIALPASYGSRMPFAARIAFAITVSTYVFANAASAQTAIAAMTEAEIKPVLIGTWSLDVGDGPSTFAITDVQNGQLSVRGPMMLTYGAIMICRGQITGDKIILDVNSATLDGTMTSPTYMEGTLSFRGDTTSPVTHWHADKVER